MNPINIIGIGLGKEDLTSKHLALIKDCDVLIGGTRHLALFDTLDKQKIPVKSYIKGIVDIIKEKMTHHKIVVLASGDPLFYGIGSILVQHFDKKYLHIHSNLSSVSAAFAAIKEPWHDAKIISLHETQEEDFLFSTLAEDHKIAFLTNPERDPYYIAAGLIKENLYDFKFCVLEKLGDRNEEKITWYDSLNQIKNQTFSHPNIVVLLRRMKAKNNISHETYIGMKDSMFKHSKGLITKSEIRSITLSKLKLIRKDHVFWDIGSGSGSVGIEASFQVPLGHVYAIEKHPGRIADIVHNINNFKCSNITVFHTAFPEGIEELKTPDRIFIGGGGRTLEQIINVSCDKLTSSGIIVINTVLLQNLETALRCLKKHKFEPQVVQIQIFRSKGMPFGDRLEALNPVWIISGVKP